MRSPQTPGSAKAGWLAALSAAVALGLAGYLLYDCLFTILMGFALAYLCDPLADWLEVRGVGRTAAVFLIMGGLAGAALLGLALIIPGIIAQTREFSVQFPEYFAQAVDRVAAWADTFGVSLPQDRGELRTQLRGWLENASLAALKPVGRFAGRFFSSVAGMLVGLLNLLVVPVVFFYFLRDIDLLRDRTLELAPPRYRKTLARRLDQTDRVFSGFIRGQIVVASILAVLYSVGLGLVGIRFGVVIGLLAGALNIIPYLGVLTGLALSLVMALVDFTSVWKFVGVFGVFGLAQFLEGFFITPRVVGDKVGLTPFETILALIVAGEIGGLLGLILAIPAAGCLKVYLKEAAAGYRESDFYKDDN